MLWGALLALMPWGAVYGRAAQPDKPAPVNQQVREQDQPVRRGTDGRLVWDRPRSDERQKERDRLVDDLARPRADAPAVRDERVLAAMRAVPRHWFVPEGVRELAYIDRPLPIGNEQTISQPYIVALMTELLEVKAGDRVLEIGTGSGYQAAVLSELTPHVFTIEIVEPLYKRTTAMLKEKGYGTVQTRLGDGYKGWKEEAPFDAIIVTCGADDVPEPLWEQLKPGGRMVIPVGSSTEMQRLLVVKKREDGTRETKPVLAVRFVPMTGENQKK